MRNKIKMHGDDNKHNVKEMECKRKIKKTVREIKCMKEIKIKCRGVQAVIWGCKNKKKLIGPRKRRRRCWALEKETEPVWFK